MVKELMRRSDMRATLRHHPDVSRWPLAEAVANLPAVSGPMLHVLGSHPSVA